MHCPFAPASETKITIRAWLQRAMKSAVAGSVWLMVSGLPRLSCRAHYAEGHGARWRREPFNEEKPVRDSCGRWKKGQSARKSWKTRWLILKRPLNGEPEIKSRDLGEVVATELRQLTKSHVRFASVYRSFQDLEEFKREIDSMGQVKRQKRKRVVVQNDRDQVFLAEALKLAKEGLYTTHPNHVMPARQGRCRDWSWLSCKGWRHTRR